MSVRGRASLLILGVVAASALGIGLAFAEAEQGYPDLISLAVLDADGEVLAVVGEGTEWKREGDRLKLAFSSGPTSVDASFSVKRLEAAAFRRGLRTLGAVGVFALILILVANRLVGRASTAIRRERENLEATVDARTRELREANARLETLAVTDGLTGVFNHRRFHEALGHEVMRSTRSRRPLSVLMIDVDHFKALNDAYGHPAGDAVLRGLAEALSHELRATDLLARYGGEEFAVLLPEAPQERALQVAERLRAAVESKGLHGATVSVGVATFPQDGESAALLLSVADGALYRAKHRGRNRVVAAGAEVAA
jgi:diguanylate cyclase (GGDEF)-like protein